MHGPSNGLMVSSQVSVVCDFNLYSCLLKSDGLHRLNVTISHTTALSVLVHWVSNDQDDGKRSGRKNVCCVLILLLIISERLHNAATSKCITFVSALPDNMTCWCCRIHTAP